ncbi:MAG: hypothetical protein JSS83_00955 [Cyanobacteria bacterium SZAS LIN-3]|nr:hypothetical protein [Cyanobacteria bacterium SZAS LIN-3]
MRITNLQTALIEDSRSQDLDRIEETTTGGGGATAPLLIVLAAIAVLVGSGIFFWLNHPMLIYPDQALYVHMAKLLLQGKVPYVDMFDNNPPLAIYLQVVPVWLAQGLKWTEPLAFSLYIWALIIISCTAGGIALWRADCRGSLLVGLAALVGFVYFNQHQVLDFGQREHIFTILYLPFFIVRYLRWQDKRLDLPLAILVGAMAGLGISLKHYFLLVALAPEIVWAIEKRDVRPLFRAETLSLGLVIFLYLLHFLFLPRQELEMFFGVIVPIYKAGYSYYTTSLSYNLNTFWRGDFYLMALTSLGALILARQSSFVMPLQAFSLMSALIFVLAGQVWSYHVTPVRMASEVAIFVQTFLFCRYLPAALKRGKAGPIALALALLAFVSWQTYLRCRDILVERERGEMFFLPTLGYDGECPSSDINPYTQIVIDRTSKDDSILFISSSMGPSYPVYLQSRRRPASRFLHAMVLPLLASIIDDPNEPDRAVYKERLKQFLDWYAEDIATNKPKLIIVQNNFIHGLLSQRNFFKKYMSDYKLVLTPDEYKVYLREPGR